MKGPPCVRHSALSLQLIYHSVITILLRGRIIQQYSWENWYLERLGKYSTISDWHDPILYHQYVTEIRIRTHVSFNSTKVYTEMFNPGYAWKHFSLPILSQTTIPSCSIHPSQTSSHPRFLSHSWPCWLYVFNIEFLSLSCFQTIAKNLPPPVFPLQYIFPTANKVIPLKCKPETETNWLKW